MHRLIQICFLAALLTFGSAIHNAEAQGLTGYGFKAIAASSTTTDYLAGQEESLWGVGVAAFAEWHIAGPLSVMPQLEYAPRGVNQLFAVGNDEGRFKSTRAETRLHYLSLPLFAKASYRFDETPFVLYATLGPRIDLLIGSDSGTFEFEDESISSGLAQRYDQTAFGISGGVGLQITISEDIALTFEARQHRDVIASVREGGTQLVDTTVGDIRNLATDFSVGIKWQ